MHKSYNKKINFEDRKNGLHIQSSLEEAQAKEALSPKMIGSSIVMKTT